jgi:hypothetical protein
VDPSAKDPIDRLQADITKLLANQRTPGTVEVRRGWFVVLIILGALMVVLGTLNIVSLATRSHATSTSAPAGVTDRHLAGQLDAICARHGDVCGPRLTAATMPGFVTYVCQEIDSTPASPAAWVAAWSEIKPVVVSSGRCS